jgi:hypothetical protein
MLLFLQFQQARQSQSPSPQHDESASVEGLDERRKDFSTFCRSPTTPHKCTRTNSISTLQQGKSPAFPTPATRHGKSPVV